MAVEFPPEKLAWAQKMMSRYPRKESAVLPVLYLAQEEFGYLSVEAMEYVSGLMEIPLARLYGIVTFYTMFHKRPIGKYHVQVCRTLPCALSGSRRITDLLRKKLGIELEGTTADGRFTLSEVECLASCGTAPVMQVNEECYEAICEENVEQILQSLE